MHVYATCMQEPEDSREDMRSRTAVNCSYELSDAGAGNQTLVLQEQQALLTTDRVPSPGQCFSTSSGWWLHLRLWWNYRCSQLVMKCSPILYGFSHYDNDTRNSLGELASHLFLAFCSKLHFLKCCASSCWYANTRVFRYILHLHMVSIFTSFF